MTNYKIPLDFTKLSGGQTLDGYNLKQSISKHLELVILTRFGEHRSDPTYGCEIWNLDFELIVSESLWSEKLRKSMLHSVKTHEPRLSNIAINVTIKEVARANVYRAFTEIKKKVEINVSGEMVKTGDAFDFTMDLYLSPLSVD